MLRSLYAKEFADFTHGEVTLNWLMHREIE